MTQLRHMSPRPPAKDVVDRNPVDTVCVSKGSLRGSLSATLPTTLDGADVSSGKPGSFVRLANSSVFHNVMSRVLAVRPNLASYDHRDVSLIDSELTSHRVLGCALAVSSPYSSDNFLGQLRATVAAAFRVSALLLGITRIVRARSYKQVVGVHARRIVALVAHRLASIKNSPVVLLPNYPVVCSAHTTDCDSGIASDVRVPALMARGGIPSINDTQGAAAEARVTNDVAPFTTLRVPLGALLATSTRALNHCHDGAPSYG